jgi:hypothetical protein
MCHFDVGSFMGKQGVQPMCFCCVEKTLKFQVEHFSSGFKFVLLRVKNSHKEKCKSSF